MRINQQLLDRLSSEVVIEAEERLCKFMYSNQIPKFQKRQDRDSLLESLDANALHFVEHCITFPVPRYCSPSQVLDMMNRAIGISSNFELSSASLFPISNELIRSVIDSVHLRQQALGPFANLCEHKFSLHRILEQIYQAALDRTEFEYYLVSIEPVSLLSILSGYCSPSQIPSNDK